MQKVHRLIHIPMDIKSTFLPINVLMDLLKNILAKRQLGETVRNNGRVGRATCTLASLITGTSYTTKSKYQNRSLGHPVPPMTLTSSLMTH